MNDPLLRAYFIEDTKIAKTRLRDALKDGNGCDLIDYLKDDYTAFRYSTDNGDCEVIEWRGYYFSESEWDSRTGPHKTLNEALEPIRYLLECGDDIDTESATHIVDSKWPDKQTFEVIRRIVSVGDVVEVNGVKYNRTKEGYAKE
jgi:hypothetical protein